MTAPGEQFPLVPLWKFVSLSEDQTPTWQDKLTALSGGRAFLSSPEDFNDPFDCLPHFLSPNDMAEIPDFLGHLSAKISRALGNISPNDVQKKLEDNLTDVGPEELHLLIRKSAAQTSKNLGVFCLTEAVEDVLMWSHYAANHGGIAIGFRFDRIKRGGLTPISRVTYQADRPSVDITSPDEQKREIADALTIKAQFWSYEREWRCIRPDSCHHFQEFDPAMIDRVVFGVRCSDQVRGQVKEVLRERSIRYFEAVPALGTFDMRFREV